MIEFITGNIISKNPSCGIINTAGGIGYKINITINTYNSLPESNTKIKLLTYFNITEKINVVVSRSAIIPEGVRRKPVIRYGLLR